jgi:hypothetical protein
MQITAWIIADIRASNGVWAAVAWNLRKVTRVHAGKQTKAAQRKTKCAA